MLSDRKVTNEQITTFAEHAVTADIEIGNSRFGLGLIMAMAGFVGFWGCICLINGIAQSTDLQELGRGIITALTGV